MTGDLDVAAVLRRRDSMTSNWNDAGQVSWLEGAGIELVRGHGRLTGEKTVGAVARGAIGDVADDLMFGAAPIALQ